MSDFDTLTGSGAWGATPEDYNSLNILIFGKDGSGQLVLGYGQAIFAEVTYRFELTSSGILRIEYVDSTANDLFSDRGELGRRIVEAERDAPREISYALSSGQFQGTTNMGTEKGPFTYHFRWALTLARSPYPEQTVLPFGRLPSAAPYTYYGYPVVGEDLSGSDISRGKTHDAG